MRKLLLFLFSCLLLFVGYTLQSTGFFRTINVNSPNKIIAHIPLKGAEDIVIDQEGHFAIISATNRESYPPNKPETGGLYYIDLEDANFTPIDLTASLPFTFAPHGIDMFKLSDSTYQILAINHVNKQHSIEQFILNGTQLTHLETHSDKSMVQPNDLVIISPDEFYFTNDHGYTKGLGKIVEEYSGMALSNVVHVKQKKYVQAATGIAYANGIAHDKKRELLYVASPRQFNVSVYRRAADASLQLIEKIPTKTGVDNLTVDDSGNLWVGAHPNLLRFQAYAMGKYAIAPSEIILINYQSEGQYAVESIWVDDGEKMSGATVAVPYQDWVLVGNVMDDHFLILEQ